MPGVYIVWFQRARSFTQRESGAAGTAHEAEQKGTPCAPLLRGRYAKPFAGTISRGEKAGQCSQRKQPEQKTNAVYAASPYPLRETFCRDDFTQRESGAAGTAHEAE
jgi:hypothetical protein